LIVTANMCNLSRDIRFGRLCKAIHKEKTLPSQYYRHFCP